MDLVLDLGYLLLDVGHFTPTIPLLFKNLMLWLNRTILITKPRILVAMGLKEFKTKVNDSKFGFLFYLVLITLLSTFFYWIAPCFAYILIPLSALAIPYYLGFKGVKKFAVLGVFILITLTFIFGAVITSRAYDYHNIYGLTEDGSKNVDPQFGGENLTQGVVFPKTGDADTIFTYTVNYVNTPGNLTPLYVNVIVADTPYENDSIKTVYNMTQTDPSDTNYSDGAEFEYQTALPASAPIGWPIWPNHFFYFETEDANGTVTDTALRGNGITSYGFGPMNAELGDQYAHSLVLAVNDAIFVIALYFMGVGMYWWLKKARQRSSQWQDRVEEMKKEEYAEFECDRCGADVPEDAEECPKCGAKFDDEEEEEKKDTRLKISEFECDKCGAEVLEDAEFCHKCGEKFDN
jgi:ribosomal protein L40E